MWLLPRHPPLCCYPQLITDSGIWACTSVDMQLFLSRFPVLVTTSVEIASLSRGHCRQEKHLGESANAGGNNSDSEARMRNKWEIWEELTEEQLKG